MVPRSAGEHALSISLSEEIRALSDWPKHLPTRRGGKRIHVSTLYRWALHGCRGVKLESLQLGGTLATSREGLERFFARLAAGRESDSASPARASIPAYREREIAEASRKAAEALR